MLSEACLRLPAAGRVRRRSISVGILRFAQNDRLLLDAILARSEGMTSPKHILIAGGGPAGALCGERLARAGFRVTLFEERRGWEKPCGGGVTWKT
ncbi:MAG: NAD(P)-binding protein, partial [Terriglobia bacterium]